MRIDPHIRKVKDVQDNPRFSKTLPTKVDESSPDFVSNKKAMLRELQGYNILREKIEEGGSKRATEKHVARGKMTARGRIKGLLDKDSYFLELSPLAGHELYDRPLPAGGVITGIGKVQGKECMIVANDATVMGGVYYPITAKKHLRAQEIAQQNKLPCIYLVDSGGAMLEKQDEVFPDKDHFGRIFYNQARMSAEGIPQIAAVMGSCTAGGAYIPAMSEEAVIVEGTGTIFLAGPPLVQAAIGQKISADDLGGANVHTSISGVADHCAESDPHALSIVRDLVSHLPEKDQEEEKMSPENTGEESTKANKDEDIGCCSAESKGGKYELDWNAPPPVHSPESIYGVIPENPLQSYDVREVIARIVDGSEFSEFKKNYGVDKKRMRHDTTLVCGTAKLYGHTVGIIANNGILDSQASKKGAEFIQRCSNRKTPLIFLQNTTGYQVGRDAEHGGIAKDGAKMVTAVSCANVPKFTVVIGGSYGAGNYGMCGRAFDPRFLWMWPNSKIAVMGPNSAVGVMSNIKKESSKAKGKPWSTEDEKKYKEKLSREYNSKSKATYSSARLWDDGIIDPAKTREILGQGLSISLNAPIVETKFGHFRM